MITINIAIDYRDLMVEEKEKDEATAASMLEHVKSIIENSVLSSLEDVAVATPEGRKRCILGTTQRDVNRILDALDAVGKDGVLAMPDKRMIKFQKLWEGRLGAPAGGPNRKLHQRIDRIICPDAYKGDAEDSDEAA